MFKWQKHKEFDVQMNSLRKAKLVFFCATYV